MKKMCFNKISDDVLWKEEIEKSGYVYFAQKKNLHIYLSLNAFRSEISLSVQN